MLSPLQDSLKLEYVDTDEFLMVLCSQNGSGHGPPRPTPPVRTTQMPCLATVAPKSPPHPAVPNWHVLHPSATFNPWPEGISCPSRVGLVNRLDGAERAVSHPSGNGAERREDADMTKALPRLAVLVPALLLADGACRSAPADEVDGTVHVRHTFEAPGEQDAWSGWSVGQPVRIEPVHPGWQSPTCLRFSVEKRGWDTAIVEFAPPVRIGARTMVRMRLRADRPGPYGMNVRNRTEGSEYFLPFVLSGSDWTAIHKYLDGAVYKRFGEPSLPKDGLAGDEIGSIQIAYAGSRLELDDFEIVDVPDGTPEEPRQELPAATDYVPQPYPILDRVFPYGVILTVAAGDAGNASLFGQSRDERFEADLLDLKRHHMNTVANFCDDRRVEWRLSLMDRYRLHLVETRFANVDLTDADAARDSLEVIRRHRDHPRLLAWYGRDEPKDLPRYLANKRAVMACDPNHPVASAFNEMTAAKALGPFMELIMIDPYSIMPGPRRIDALAFHADLIRNAREYCAGDRVWMIAQAFSNRMGRHEVLRMPDAIEMRFEVFSAVAAGVDGLLFFIYHDTCSYLDGTVRSEEFDDTLVDPWGNASPAYEELARLGRQLVPTVRALRVLALPSRIEVAPGPAVPGLTVGRLDTAGVACLVPVTLDLEKGHEGRLPVPVPPEGAVYDLLDLQPVVGDAEGRVPLRLAPGAGAVLAAMPTRTWPHVRAAILRERARLEHELLTVEATVLSNADVEVRAAAERLADLEPRLDAAPPEDLLLRLAETRKLLAEARQAKPEYARTTARLAEVQEAFGQVHRLVRPHVSRLDASEDPEWRRFCQGLKACSTRYFVVRRGWQAGDCSGRQDLDGVAAELEELRAAFLRLAPASR